MDMIRKWFNSWGLVLAMIIIQLISAGNQLLSKVILVNGTFIFALVAYRSFVASLIVAPLALYFEREKEKNFGWRAWFWIFIIALCGGLKLTLFYYGLRDTTATYTSNFYSIIPIVTYIFAVVTRIEKLKLNTREGIVKCVGALICVGGALTASLYNGLEFKIRHSPVHTHIPITLADSHQHWTRGTLLLVAGCITYAAWYIVQVKLIESLPLIYWDAMLQNLVRALQSAIIGLSLNQSSNAWKLEWNLQLFTIIYSGFLSALVTIGNVWAISKEGPTYPPMFSGVSLIFVAILDALVLGEAITMGILLGMTLILFGLYSFLWAKRSERSNKEDSIVKTQLSTIRVEIGNSPTQTKPREVKEGDR